MSPPRGDGPRRERAGLWKRELDTKRYGLSRRWRRVIGLGFAFFALICGIMGGLIAYASLTLPDINQLGQTTGTITILDRNGATIAQIGHNDQSRHTVLLEAISQQMQNATLAAEDRNFYNEGALNYTAVVRALIKDVILRSAAEGASTITQQLAKQAFFGATADKSPLRKLREALLANEIDGMYTKQEILQKYLNISYFGQNAYGIEDAAQRYFGKDASQLNLQESAVLAGLLQAPSGYDPYQNPEAAWSRAHYVLCGLVAMGTNTEAQVAAVDPLVGDNTGDSSETNCDEKEGTANQAANQQALTTDLQNGKPANYGLAPHFAQYIEDQLNTEFADDPAYLDGDLTVTTTLDLNLQQLATTAVTAGLTKKIPGETTLAARGANNAAMLMMDPNTGDILAMVGSANFGDNSIAGQYNITTAERRPGSSFKPYVYETGFQNGNLTPSTILDDTKAESEQLGGVQDFDRLYEGKITAAQALVRSRNIATEQAMQIAGIDNVINFAHSLGITTDLQPNVSTAIGTSSVKMIEQAAAYSAFANGGTKVTARGITKVVAGDGTVLFDQPTPADEGEVMTSSQAYEITNILEGYQKQWGEAFKYQTAGKSGTTDNFVDAWYMVYTPSWVVATWAGHTDGNNPAEVGMNGVFGTDEGKAIAVPFVNSLPKPASFSPVSGASTDCGGGTTGTIGSGCPTPTPAPTPEPTETPSPSPSPTPCVTPTATLPPVVTTPC